MTKKLLYLLGILITILLGTYFYWLYCCSICCQTKEIILQPKDDSGEVRSVELNGFNLSVEGFNFKCSQNFNFNKNEFNRIEPVKDSIKLGVNKLSEYLYKFPDQQVVITGFSSLKEENTSAFPNLGFARAHEVKNFLRDNGISAGQIKTQGEVVEDLITRRKVIIGPIDFTFISKKKDGGKGIDWAVLKKEFNDNPLQLNFNSGAVKIKLSEDQRKKINDLTSYLDNIEGSIIIIVGHTDNQGNREDNTSLGLERAEFAKNYLSRNGVNPARIEVISKGSDEPIDANNTVDGRANNRRTIVLIK
jgi:outer membrane protein OmpA-like peptidoglycan-associated protein